MITKKMLYYRVSYTVKSVFTGTSTYSMEFDRMMYVEDFIDSLKEDYEENLIRVVLETVEEIQI